MTPLLARIECLDAQEKPIICDSYENYGRIMGMLAVAGEAIAKERPEYFPILPTYVIYNELDEGINYG